MPSKIHKRKYGILFRLQLKYPKNRGHKMSTKRQVRKHSAKEKSKIVLETLKEDKTIAQIGSEYNVHPRNIQYWRKKFLENVEVVFDKEQIVRQYKEELKDKSSEIDELHRQIGELTAQLNWAKKKSREAESIG